MKDAYWARFFQRSDGGYYADLPDLPGCSTEGTNVDQVYSRLVNEAIPLWLEDQTWPPARGADQILAAPRGSDIRPMMLVRISISEVGGPAVGTWSVRTMESDHARRRPLN